MSSYRLVKNISGGTIKKDKLVEDTAVCVAPEVSINLHSKVRVELTDYGAKIYNLYYRGARVTAISEGREPPIEVEAGHELEEPLWFLFSMFGASIQLWIGSPFVDMRLVVLRP